MKGEFALCVLEKIMEAGAETGSLFEAFLSSGYGASVGKVEYEYRKIRRRKQLQESGRLNYVRLRRRYDNTLAWLKREGLIIASRKTKEGVSWPSLTHKGLSCLQKLRKRTKNQPPSPVYPTTKTKNEIIVIFDIPERERLKRSWLRLVLRNAGFRMIQKSVWMGRSKFPRDFLEDLHRMGILEFVEIFEVTKLGTLHDIDKK